LGERTKNFPVDFRMSKLQVACVVEDDKVSLEDPYEQFEGWAGIQSTDTVSLQKL
jgi:translation elongation factor EF-1beta